MVQHCKLIFDFNWKLTAFVVFLFPVLVVLSIWQVKRAEEKALLSQAWLEQQAAAPVMFQANKVVESHHFRRVFMSGVYSTEKYWLKENQFHNGQLGYNVIMPFQTIDGTVLAVDRGWVAGSPLRDFVPDIETPKGKVKIVGALVVPSDSKLIREAEVSAKRWPHKILEVDLPVLSQQSELTLFTRLLRLDADSPGAFDVNWRPINMSAAKHYGYAVQWGLMAFVLLIMYLFSSTNLRQWLKKTT